MVGPIYQWKHGWIPLTHTAALSKAKGSETAAGKILKKTNPSAAVTHKWQGKNDVTVKPHSSGRLHVQSPYDRQFIAEVKDLGGTWSPKSKTWSVPGSRANELDDLLTKAYGKSLDTDTIPAASLPRGVDVRDIDGRIIVNSPYNDGFRQDAKSIGGQWRSDRRAWQFPKHREKDVRDLIAKHYKDTPSVQAQSRPLPQVDKASFAGGDRPASKSQVDRAWTAVVRAMREGGYWHGQKLPSYDEISKMSARQVRGLIMQVEEEY